ncbi:zinc-binding dehydrogenase, partial [Streptomyces sp. NPDC002265]|uniref:zinc-binding dehydrogenase n=1 Tax=Streptomyces sp. NPDC002265 TaxID=3154415 RepID=UPI003323BBC4
IHGAAGGVGTVAAQLAGLAGAGRIVGVVGSPNRARYAARFGFDRILLRAELPDAAGEERFDVVLDPVGGRTRRDGLRMLAPHGRLVAYGTVGGGEPALADTDDLLMSGTSLLTYNSHLLGRTHPQRLADSARQALGLLADGRIRIDITAEYALDEVGTAVQRLREGATVGKSVLRIDGSPGGRPR